MTNSRDKAIVENGIVTTVLRAGTYGDLTQPPYDALTIIDAVPGVVPGMVHDPVGGLFSAPVQAPTVDDVRSEASRRMITLLGARDAAHMDLIITNGLREAARLLQKEVAGQVLTPEEAARKIALSQVDAAIEAIRAASNVLEAMSPIPADYAADSRWP